jgi:hypothetical protein
MREQTQEQRFDTVCPICSQLYSFGLGAFLDQGNSHAIQHHSHADLKCLVNELKVNRRLQEEVTDAMNILKAISRSRSSTLLAAPLETLPLQEGLPLRRKRKTSPEERYNESTRVSMAPSALRVGRTHRH